MIFYNSNSLQVSMYEKRETRADSFYKSIIENGTLDPNY